MIKYPIVPASGGSRCPKGYNLRADEATWAPIIKPLVTTYKTNEEYVYVDLQHPDWIRLIQRRLRRAQHNV